MHLFDILYNKAYLNLNSQEKKKKRTKAEAMVLTDEEEETALEFLKSYPCLYNNGLRDYKKTDLKNKLWDDLAKKLNRTSKWKYFVEYNDKVPHS